MQHDTPIFVVNDTASFDLYHEFYNPVFCNMLLWYLQTQWGSQDNTNASCMVCLFYCVGLEDAPESPLMHRFDFICWEQEPLSLHHSLGITQRMEWKKPYNEVCALWHRHKKGGASKQYLVQIKVTDALKWYSSLFMKAAIRIDENSIFITRTYMNQRINNWYANRCLCMICLTYTYVYCKCPYL